MSQISRNSRGQSAGRSRKSGRRGSTSRTFAASSQAETSHVQRLRGSRSASDIGYISIHGSRPVDKMAALYSIGPAGSTLGPSASAAELGGISFKTERPQAAWSVSAAAAVKQSRRKKSAGMSRFGSAPRERLAARRRSTQETAAKPKSMASRVVSAVQGLDASSKQALKQVIRLEKESRSQAQQREAEAELIANEIASNGGKHDDDDVFATVGLMESSDLTVQAEAASKALSFCSEAPGHCPTISSRILTVFNRLMAAHADSAEIREAAVQAERSKWEARETKAEAKEAALQRRHKEELSKLASTMASDISELKSKFQIASAERDVLKSECSETKLLLEKERKKNDALVGKLKDLKSAEALSNSKDLGIMKANDTPQPTDTVAGDPCVMHADDEVRQLKIAVEAANSELGLMKTRLKKVLAARKKDIASRTELEEALKHARAQVANLMEKSNTLSTSVASEHKGPASVTASSDSACNASAGASSQTDACLENFTEHATALKELQQKAITGKASTLNIGRGTCDADMELLSDIKSVDLSADVKTLELQADGSKAVDGDAVFEDGCSTLAVNLTEMFGAEASPIQQNSASTFDTRRSDGEIQEPGKDSLDDGFIIETSVDDGDVDAVKLREECARLRDLNAELEAALAAALGGSSAEEEEEDIELACNKKLLTPTGRNKLLPRPGSVPALDFELMASKLKQLDEEEAQREAEEREKAIAENASKGESTVLEEVVDPDYVPSESDILEYATFLGIDLEAEPELAWIVKKGLVAPLPDGWKPCAAPDGALYYFNFDTGESVWDHPGDDYYKALVAQERARLQG